MQIQKCCRAWYGDVNCPHRPAGLVIYLWAGPLVSLVWPTLVPQSILWVNICGWFCWWANLSWVHIHYSPFMQPAMKSRTLEIEMTGNLLQSRGTVDWFWDFLERSRRAATFPSERFILGPSPPCPSLRFHISFLEANEANKTVLTMHYFYWGIMWS